MINSTFLAILRSVRLRPLFCGWTISFWLLAEFGMGQAGRDKVLEGNSLFTEGRFEEAHEKYQQALEEDPSSEVIRYNLGDAEYKKNLYEEAIEAFSQASQTEEPELQARASYNLGNALYRLGKLEDSIQAYKEALRIDPGDTDSKHNLEFVNSKLAEQEQQKQQDKQEKQEDKKDQDQQDQENQDKSQNEQGNQDQKQDGEQGQNTPEEQDSDQNQPEQQKDQGKEQAEQQQDSGSEQADSQATPKMSREEAERLLEALSESNNELKTKKLETKGRVPVEKDW